MAMQRLSLRTHSVQPIAQLPKLTKENKKTERTSFAPLHFLARKKIKMKNVAKEVTLSSPVNAKEIYFVFKQATKLR